MTPIPSPALRNITTHTWTPEKLANQDRKSVELIKERALKHGVTDLITMCEQDLQSRKQVKSKTQSTPPRHSSSNVVEGYHFVCARERGVTEATEGKFWSGSWVVAEANARKSIAKGAYLALHEAKNEVSYRQGKILDFRRAIRDMVEDVATGKPPQIEYGIEFLVEQTNQPYEWVGDGAGEKGYRWSQDSSSQAQVDLRSAINDEERLK